MGEAREQLLTLSKAPRELHHLAAAAAAMSQPTGALEVAAAAVTAAASHRVPSSAASTASEDILISKETAQEIDALEKQAYKQAVIERRKAMSDFSKELLQLQLIDDIFDHHGFL